MRDTLERASHIRLLVLDVDGVLTDGRLFFTAEGQEIKAFDTQDGHGIKMLRQSGVEVAIITGRISPLVEHRARNLGITHLYQGREDKLVALRELLPQLGMGAAETAYVGDDLPDLPAIRFAGLGIAVANAHAFVQEHADHVTRHSGGRGAVREVCDLILQAQGKLESLHQHYLSTE